MAAETWLAFFYTRMREYLRDLLGRIPLCTGTQWQKDVLGAILENMNRERPAADTLRFESGRGKSRVFSQLTA
jgi:hypothetical protein